MANLIFKANLNGFISWYFGINNVSELSESMLADVCNLNEQQSFLIREIFTDNINAVATFEIVPDKMNADVQIKFNGYTVTLPIADESEFIDTLVNTRERADNYKGFDIWACNIADGVVYSCAGYRDFPETNLYFSDVESAKNWLCKYYNMNDEKVVIKSADGHTKVIITGYCHESAYPCCNHIFTDAPVFGDGLKYVELIGKTRTGKSFIYRPICTRDENGDLISDFRAYNVI